MREQDKLAAKTEQIHILTNSNLSAVHQQLDVANEKIIGLEKLINNLILQAAGESQIRAMLAWQNPGIVSPLPLTAPEQSTKKRTQITTPEETTIPLPPGTVIETEEG